MKQMSLKINDWMCSFFEVIQEKNESFLCGFIFITNFQLTKINGFIAKIKI